MHDPTYTRLCTEIRALLDGLLPRLPPVTLGWALHIAETCDDDCNDAELSVLASLLMYSWEQLEEHDRFIPGEYARVTAVIDATLKYFGVL
jgi:hypothetical protein